ncbi:MAG TPA: hypothetical protein PLQ66_10915, partial [Anaerolineae bacterium]|nr:hypothetical protein [Anaerolineae bacterium]
LQAALRVMLARDRPSKPRIWRSAPSGAPRYACQGSSQQTADLAIRSKRRSAPSMANGCGISTPMD